MVCQQGIRRYSRSAGLVVLLAALAVQVSAQLVTELSERSLAVGERVFYVVTIDHEEPADVVVEPPEFPGVRVVEGPSIRPVSILAGSGRERAIEVRFTLEAVAPGRYVLPGVPVSVAGQPYLTAERLLEIGERRNRGSVPFLARWSGEDRMLYVGEAAIFELEIYNVPDYLYPSSISMDAPQGAIFEEVQGLGTIEQYTVDGVTLYAIPIAVFVVTASQAGTLTLPEARIATETLGATAPRRALDVRELPEAVEASGAVGSFAYQTSLDPVSFLSSETTRLTIRVAGSGNLHFLALPEPVLEGFQIEQDERSTSLSATERGYEGWTQRVLTLRPDDAAVHRIEPGAFVYLDPADSRIVHERATVPAPTVQATNEPLVLEGTEVSLEPLDRDELAALERRIWYRDPLAYGWLVPGLLAFVTSRIWKRRQTAGVVVIACGALLLTDAVADRLPWEAIDLGLDRYAEGDIPAAIYAFEDAARAVSDSPGINYNLAVLHFHSGDVPRAAFAVREAIRLAPFFDRGRSFLATLERTEGIERSVPPPHVVHPDLFFVIIAVLVNALFVGLAFVRRSRRGWTVIVGILIVVLVLGSVAGLVASAVLHDQQLAVVRGDITLRRVPGEEGGGWLLVQGGSAVRVVARHGDATLVRTALGLEGWVELRDLIWPGSPVSSLLRYRGFAL